MNEEAPLCECHGSPKRWVVDRKMAKGGRWRCREKDKQYGYDKEKKRKRDKTYYYKNIETVRERNRQKKRLERNKNPEKFRERCKVYRQEHPLETMIYNRRKWRRKNLQEIEARLLTMKTKREVST